MERSLSAAAAVAEDAAERWAALKREAGSWQVRQYSLYIRGRGWGCGRGRSRALGGAEAGDGVVAGTAVRGVRGRYSETFTSLCRSPASPPPRRPMGAPLKPFFLPPPLLDLQARLEDSEQAKQALVLAGTRRQQEMERQLEQVRCGG